MFRDEVHLDPCYLLVVLKRSKTVGNSNLPSHPLVDGIIYDSHIDIANFFNAHFANITSSVVLNQNETSNLDYLKDLVRSKLPQGASFIIPPITSVFVLDSLRHLPTGKAVGLDGLNGYFLKLSAPSIVYRVFSNNNF